MVMKQRSEQRHKGTILYHVAHSGFILRSITLLVLGLLLVACGAPTSAPVEAVVQTALPTPTSEPTFTPVPPPTSTSQPSPTATLAEPTPTPTPQSTLSGRVLDQATNQPISGAKVSVGTATATTYADGRYTLAGLPPGQYVLSVTHPDYDPGLSSIFTLAAAQELSLDLALYAPDTSLYPKDPMLTNPLDPNGAPTAEDAERLARLQGLTGEVANVQETKLSGEYLVNYKISDEVRAAVADLNHDVWELTDDAGRMWWILKVCGNLASPLLQEAPIATPAPRPLPPMAEVVVDDLIVRECASQECAEAGTIQSGARIEVLGCLADGSWCQVSLSGGGSGWCTGQSLRQLAVAKAISVVEAVLPTATPEVVVVPGDRIAFSSDRDGNDEIYVMNANGTDLRRLTNNQAKDWFPTWSPNGQQITFMSDFNIYVMNADGSELTRLTNQGLNWFPIWSPTGHFIAFHATRDNGNDIYVVNVGSSDLKRLTNHPANDWFPIWSPDGQWIIFASNRDGNFEIYVMNADGGGLTRLTNHPALDGAPTWSPDGRQIAFVSERDGNAEIYVMNPDGTGLKRLTDNLAKDWPPAWSPNGLQIAFVSERDGNGEIYVMNADGTGLTRLTSTPLEVSSLTWSPDGQQIAFSSKRDGSSDIYVVNTDGTSLTQLTFEGNNCCPAWVRWPKGGAE
jgi:Tol biopolymer transport system component/protocatechuate 3,4-dioxygenase beta subunit